MTLKRPPHCTLITDPVLALYNAETQTIPCLVPTAAPLPAYSSPPPPPGKEGKIGWALLWLMGIPIPILLLLFFMRGCT